MMTKTMSDEQYRRYSPLSHAISWRKVQLELRIDAKFFAPKLQDNLNCIYSLATRPGWVVRTLGSLTKEEPRRGVQPRYIRNGDLTVVKTANVQNEWISWQEASRTANALVTSEQAVVRKNELVITSTGEGSWGRVGLCDIERAVVDGHITIVCLDTSQLDPFYALAYFWTPIGRALFEQRVRGCTGQTEIYTEDIAKVPVAIPPRSYRSDIVAQLRESLQRKREAESVWKDLMEGFYNHYQIPIPRSRDISFSIKAHVAECEGRLDARFHEHQVAEFVRELSRKRFNPLSNYIESIRYGTSATTYPSGDFPLLRIENIDTGRIVDLKKWVYVRKSSLSNVYAYQVNESDILFSRSGTYVGIPAWVDANHSGHVYGSYMLRIRLRKHCPFSSRFLVSYLNTSYGFIQAQRLGNGVNQANINSIETGCMLVPEPSADFQKEVEEKYDKYRSLMDEERTLRERAILKVESLIGDGPVEQ